MREYEIMDTLRSRFFWGIALVTVILVGLCATTAIYLFQEYSRITHVFRENIASRKAAVEMEECLAGLIAQEADDRVESVAALHGRVRQHLIDLTRYADQPEEKKFCMAAAAGFDEYLTRWNSLPPRTDPKHSAAVQDAAQFLETRVLEPCRNYRLFNGVQLEEAAEHHEQVLRRLGLGMAGVGVLGGVAGLVFGFGVARGLSRSIRRLQVQIRDAAGKLGPPLPQIVLTREGDFLGLQEQVDQLAGRIETVVAALQQRDREVLRAEQLAAVGQLAAGVAHEVRNPLTSIKMLVQLALEQGCAAPPEDLQVIDGEIRKMEQTLRAFLDFARPPKAERRPVNLLEVIAGVMGLIRGRAEKQHVAVRVYDPGRPVVVVADSDQLRQVFVNLILNALDAMPSGGVLYLVIREVAGDIEVEVADNGPGIATEIAPKLFQPFVSGKDTGLGLGLVISRRIVEDHGGKLTGSNRDDGGATFTVTLPKS